MTPVTPEEWRAVCDYLPPLPCTTAPNGTGARCTCSNDCQNYWIRAHGLAVTAPRKNWLRRLFR